MLKFLFLVACASAFGPTYGSVEKTYAPEEKMAELIVSHPSSMWEQALKANISVAGSAYTTSDNAYTYNTLIGTQLITRPTNIYISCAEGGCTPGDVVGFDYIFTYRGKAYNLAFHHTVKSGDRALNALSDIAAQYRSNALITEVIGKDIQSYALVREDSFFQFYQNVNLVETGSPSVVAYANAGATESVRLIGGGKRLEVSPFVVCGRTTINKGRPPQKGDIICGEYFTGDTPTTAADFRNINPMLGQVMAIYTDPSTGKMGLNFIMDSVNFEVGSLSVNGAPVIASKSMLEHEMAKFPFLAQMISLLLCAIISGITGWHAATLRIRKSSTPTI